MLIACAVGIYLFLIGAVDIVRNGVGLRTELHKPKRRAGTGKTVPHARRANHRVDIIHERLLRKGDKRKKHGRGKCRISFYFHSH